MPELGQRAKAASRLVARASSAARNEALHRAAELLEERTDAVLSANADDVARAERAGADPTALDRLRLDAGRLEAMATGLRTVAGLPDPVGEIVEGWVRPNGLRVERVRVPLGVVGIIYENRPNVTSDAAALCLKAGNAVLLRGSSSAIDSNRAVASALRDGLDKAGLPTDAVILVEDTSRDSAVAFMQLEGSIDCLIPRGGPSLLASVREHATVPYVLDGAGNCHVYVDRAADLAMAESIVVNAKTQRPGVCNSAETVLVHRDVADAFLPRLARALAGVTLLGDARVRSVLPDAGEATERGLRHRVPGPDPVGGRGRRPRRGHRPHRPVQLGALRGHRHRRPGCGRPVHRRGGRRRRAGQRLHPLHRRRGARPGGGDRHLHPEAPRPGPDGPRRS